MRPTHSFSVPVGCFIGLFHCITVFYVVIYNRSNEFIYGNKTPSIVFKWHILTVFPAVCML